MAPLLRLPETPLHVHMRGVRCVARVSSLRVTVRGVSLLRSCVTLHEHSWKCPFWFSRGNAAVLKMCDIVTQRTFCSVCRQFRGTGKQSAEARDAAQSILSCTRQLLTTKNYLVQYVSNAQFEKFCSRWSFGTSCFCVPGLKCL